MSFYLVQTLLLIYVVIVVRPLLTLNIKLKYISKGLRYMRHLNEKKHLICHNQTGLQQILRNKQNRIFYMR